MLEKYFHWRFIKKNTEQSVHERDRYEKIKNAKLKNGDEKENFLFPDACVSKRGE